MRRVKATGMLLLLSAVFMMGFAAIGGMVISWGTISQPSIHSIHSIAPSPYSSPDLSYLEYLRARGMGGSDTLLLQEGDAVCKDLRDDPSLTFQGAVTRSETRLGKTGMEELVKAVLIYLCDGQGL